MATRQNELLPEDEQLGLWCCAEFEAVWFGW